jgi:uncharacterized coiled-coil protein SlyX
MTEQNGPRVKRLELMLEVKEERIELLERTIREQKVVIQALSEKIRKLTEIPSTEYHVIEKKEKKER